MPPTFVQLYTLSESDSSILLHEQPESYKSCRQHEYDVRRISKFLSFFKLTKETLKYILYKVIQTT